MTIIVFDQTQLLKIKINISLKYGCNLMEKKAQTNIMYKQWDYQMSER